MARADAGQNRVNVKRGYDKQRNSLLEPFSSKRQGRTTSAALLSISREILMLSCFSFLVNQGAQCLGRPFSGAIAVYFWIRAGSRIIALPISVCLTPFRHVHVRICLHSAFSYHNTAP